MTCFCRSAPLLSFAPPCRYFHWLYSIKWAILLSIRLPVLREAFWQWPRPSEPKLNLHPDLTLKFKSSISPLTFLSTRAAVETKSEKKVRSSLFALTFVRQFVCQSTYQAIIDIIKREGVLGLYSGLNSSLLGIAITNGYGLRTQLRPQLKKLACTIISMNVRGKQSFAQGLPEAKASALWNLCLLGWSQVDSLIPSCSKKISHYAYRICNDHH